MRSGEAEVYKNVLFIQQFRRENALKCLFTNSMTKTGSFQLDRTWTAPSHVTSPLEAELWSILSAVGHLAFTIANPRPPRISILTNSRRELRKPFTDHPTVHRIQHITTILARNGAAARLAWVPDHADPDGGNQAAHGASRERFASSSLDDHTRRAPPTALDVNLTTHARRGSPAFLPLPPGSGSPDVSLCSSIRQQS